MIRTGNEKTGNSLLNIPVKARQTLTECTIAVINAEGYAETLRQRQWERLWQDVCSVSAITQPERMELSR